MAKNQGRVVVVGTGAAGLSAAVGAAASGAEVTILESASTIGGTTAWSGGEAWIANSPWQRAAGVEDSDEKAILYLQSLAIGYRDDAWITSFVKNGVRVAEGLEKSTPLHWNWFPDQADYQAELPGGSWESRGIVPDPVQPDAETAAVVRLDPRNPPPNTLAEVVHGLPDAEELKRRAALGMVARGRGLIAGLYMGARDLGAKLKVNARARDLIVEDGEVVGVVANGESYLGKVVLCAGGFERNADLVARFLRGPMVAPGGPPELLGDALLMGAAIGAKLGNMSEAFWAPCHIVPGENIDGLPYYRPLFSDRGVPGTIVVDQYGKRYANEGSNYNDWGRSMQAFDPSAYRYPRSPSWMIFDENRAGAHPNSIVNPKTAKAWLIEGATVAELAGKIGVPADNLERTIETFNTYQALGEDPEFHRGTRAREQNSFHSTDPKVHLKPLDKPPYYAVEVLAGCIGTRGGLVTDDHGRVLHEDGSVIEGLFAAGNTAANGFGHGYPGSGGTIGPALVFGWLAGETAAG